MRAIALAEKRPLDMGGFQLTAMEGHVAIFANKALSHVERAAVDLGIPHRNGDAGGLRGCAQGVHLRSVAADRIRVVLRHELQAPSRRAYHKAGDAALVARIRKLVTKRPTYGYRRITALLNRQMRAEGLERVNHKRLYRIMLCHSLLLARHHRERPERIHDGKVVAIRSNLRWYSDGFEFACWNGDIIRAAFIMDTHDREIITWRAVAGAGISGSDIRDMMMEAVAKRFGVCRAPEQIEMLSDNGSPYGARDTRIFAAQLGLKSCFTPVASPESNDVSEAFVKNDQTRLCECQRLAKSRRRPETDCGLIR